MPSADGETTAVRAPAAAWALENAVLSAAMVARRLPWADAPARALGLDALTGEGVTRSLLAHLRRTRSGRPVRLRTPFGSFLVPLLAADAEALLVRAAEAGALESPVGLTAAGRRYGLSPHAQPHGKTAPPGGELPELIARSVAEVLELRHGDGTLEWRDWHGVMTRLARRVVLGAAGADDTLLSEVVDRAAATAPAPDRRAHEAWAAALERRLAPYLRLPDPDSLTARLAEAGGHEAGEGEGGRTGGAAGTAGAGDRAAGSDILTAAVAHALALVSEALTTTALQALALHTAEPAADPRDAVAGALRRYPPVAAAVYRVRAPFVWEGLAIGADTEILCAPGWLPGQDASLPGVWPSALCGTPGDCAATRFAALVAQETVRGLTAAARAFVISPDLTAGGPPATLDPRSLVVALADGRVTAAMPTPRAPAHGCAPASYGVLARSSARRLESHAAGLAACAEAEGWSGDAEGERFRMVLLGHAERCAKAADGVRRAADRLVL
ncbi:hypothetical protein SAVIM338S_00659 [Streptomyces avidinii]